MKFILRALLGLSFAAVAGLSAAADFPTKPIRMVIPVTPGGPNDIMARTLQPRLGALLGQSVVIENIPGAGGNLATTSIVRQPADGYNLILHGMTYAVNPSIFGNTLSYKIDDLVPVSIVAKGPLVLVAHPSLGVKNVRELIAYIKGRGDGVDFASGGPGTSPHLAAELFKVMTGTKLQHIPYKGTSAFMPDLMAGRIPIAFVSPLVVKTYVESGQLIGLGVTGAKRAEGWNLPTIAEAGVPGYDFEAWYTVMTRASTPPDVVQKLNKVINEALAAPDAQEKWKSLGVEVMPGTPQEAAVYVRSEFEKWAKVVKEAGIKAE
ncbi:MAG: tripartite tricarboxylate transporter substrate binding protein [Burkholderiales bacterium]|nr:tripartite tricarboxylate transporter substrate binding protein [Burkholderiales bacterium]